jgi:hypothetical protein
MDTYSINPASIIDEAVDLSMRLTGTDFPVSIFPSKIQRIINEVHECHNYPTDTPGKNPQRLSFKREIPS